MQRLITTEMESFQDQFAEQLFQEQQPELLNRLVRMIELSEIAIKNSSMPKNAILRNIRLIANGISH